MDLFKKLDTLEDLLKQFNASIKQPKMASVKAPKPPSHKLPGNPAKSQKDPVKMAQQVQDKGTGVKPIVMDAARTLKETMSTSKNGQWSLKAPKI